MEIPIVRDLQFQIFDLKGRTIYRQEHINQSAGLSQLQWSGERNSGEGVSSGVYLIVVNGDHLAKSKKVFFNKIKDYFCYKPGQNFPFPKAQSVLFLPANPKF
ncbi:MAG: T9SS type A sorting domain-containing protein [Candidatus Marinimicrobia bacterium]|nr:T9SS type A sorting domain-containing protein [Candidatus Neomarinimicrobiota bacterium]